MVGLAPRTAASSARMAVPSIPALFVIMRVSPAFAPPAVTKDWAIANAVVITIGLSSPAVTSV